MTGRLVVLASGAGTNLAAILDAITEGRLHAEVVALVTNHRGSGAAARAERSAVPVGYWPLSPYLHGVEALQEGRPGDPDPESSPEATRPAKVATRRRYDADLANAVARARPDLVVLAGWTHLLSSSFLNQFPEQVINLHPALPGQFPGRSAIADAWAAHKAGRITRTGAMVHYVPDEGVDNGPVIASVEVPIGSLDTLDSLRRRIQDAEHELIVAATAQALAARERSLRPPAAKLSP